MGVLRVGYVGCGFMAQKVHLPNLLSLPGVELAAIAEVRPKLGRMVQERLRVPTLYADHRELVADQTIPAVVVSGHFAGQGEITADLLAAGKAVLMEKPMAVSVAQAERILAAESRGGGRLMIAYMKRYDPGYLAAKAQVDQARVDGSLGRFTFARNHGFGGDWTAGLDTPMIPTDEPYPSCAVPWPEWLPEGLRNDYLNYLQQYTHNVNLLRWLLDAGGQVEVRSAQLKGTTGVVVLSVAGVTATIESGWLDHHGWDEHVQLYAEKGWIRADSPPLLLRNQPAEVSLYRCGGKEKSETRITPAGGRAWSYREEVRHFCECVVSGAPFRSPGTDAIHDVRALEDVFRLVAAAAPRAAAAKG